MFASSGWLLAQGVCWLRVAGWLVVERQRAPSASANHSTPSIHSEWAGSGWLLAQGGWWSSVSEPPVPLQIIQRRPSIQSGLAQGGCWRRVAGGRASASPQCLCKSFNAVHPFRVGWLRVAASAGWLVVERQRAPSASAYHSTPSIHSGGIGSGAIGTSPIFKYQAALDHFQSTAFSTSPRRTGFIWM